MKGVRSPKRLHPGVTPFDNSFDPGQASRLELLLDCIVKTHQVPFRVALTGAVLSAVLLLSPRAFGHCDTMDGPVILAARTALELKDVAPVLKWVKQADEAGIRAAFAKTLAVRTKGPEARELADQFFFETLVRVHRAGEGASFTGLKPAGTPLDPPIREADEALASGSIDHLVKLVTDDVANGIRKRFTEAQEKKHHAEESVEAGRAFVAAYVEYVHYVEGLHQATESGTAHRPAESGEHSGELADREPTQHHSH